MKGLLNAIKWEAKLSMKEYISYRTSFVVDMVIFIGMFLLVYYMGIGSAFANVYQVDAGTGGILMLIGYIFWQNASSALGSSSSIIRSELAEGIFELRMQSRYHVSAVIFAKVLLTILFDCASYVGIMIFCWFVGSFQVGDIWTVVSSVVISIPSIIGMYGFGLILGGMSVREKKLGSFVMLIQSGLLLVSNAMSPTRSGFVYLIPFASGIEIVRDLYTGRAVSVSLVALYLIINLLWLVVGELFFMKAIRQEREFGSFDSY